MNQQEYKVEKYVREETNDYGRAGEIEWHLVNVHTGEPVEIFSLRRDAIAARNECNARTKGE
jgi:hypothetical protein